MCLTCFVPAGGGVVCYPREVSFEVGERVLSPCLSRGKPRHWDKQPDSTRHRDTSRSLAFGTRLSGGTVYVHYQPRQSHHRAILPPVVCQPRRHPAITPFQSSKQTRINTPLTPPLPSLLSCSWHLSCRPSNVLCPFYISRSSAVGSSICSGGLVRDSHPNPNKPSPGGAGGLRGRERKRGPLLFGNEIV